MLLTIKDPRQYRAALYIRLSKEDDSEGPSQSVQNQKALLEDFARRQKLTVFDCYIDDGFSGTRFDRPAFQQMLRDIESHQVNLVVTKDLSRLGRDYIMTGHYMEQYFPEHQVRYISLLDHIDTGVDSSENDMTPFRSIMNDLYARDISRKIKSVKRNKQQNGLFIGGKPVYGYKKHPDRKNHIVPDEEAAAVVQKIFSMALSGTTCGQIAHLLNGQGVPSPAVYGHLSGKGRGQWTSESIARMLRNETYTGNMVQGRRVKISYKSRKCRCQPAGQWVVVENTHQPLVSKETFQQVNLLLESRRHTRSRTYDFPLKGLIFCHECGHPLGVINRKNAAGQDVLYLVCRTYQRNTGGRLCTCHSIREETVSLAVEETLRRLCGPLLREEALLPMAEELVEKSRSLRDGREKETVSGQLSDVCQRLDALCLEGLGGILQKEDFQRLYEALTARREQLNQRLHALEQAENQTIREQALRLTQQFLKEAFASPAVLVSLLKQARLTEEKDLLLHLAFQEPEEVPPLNAP